MNCLARICRARGDTDMSETVFEIVEPLLSEAVDGEPMDIDGDKEDTKADEL